MFAFIGSGVAQFCNQHHLEGNQFTEVVLDVYASIIHIIRGFFYIFFYIFFYATGIDLTIQTLILRTCQRPS